MNSEVFKPIEEPKEKNLENILPIMAKTNEQKPKEEIITKLPDWNIEPPVEINRGQK